VLSKENDLWKYKNIAAENIIFCEGFSTRSNPYFNYLPLRQTKGEALIFESNELPENKIIGGVCNITPLGNHQFYAGATYDWDDIDLAPTEKKKTALIQKIEQTIKIPFKIIDHKAGIRPTVIDRRPLIGSHPKHKKMFIFNGLGTKGLSLAPYFANHFIDCLAMNTALHTEVDIKRFESKYYEQT
jgi:glycine/D-amino acid oxidase-like deaminating enzyme